MHAQAETLYRRALTLDAGSEVLFDNYKDFLSNRRPGGLYPDPSPPKIVIWRAKPVYPWMQVCGHMHSAPPGLYADVVGDHACCLSMRWGTEREGAGGREATRGLRRLAAVSRCERHRQPQDALLEAQGDRHVCVAPTR